MHKYDRCNVYATKVYEDTSKQEVFVRTYLYLYMSERKKKAAISVMYVVCMYICTLLMDIYVDVMRESAPSLPIVLEIVIKKYGKKCMYI